MCPAGRGPRRDRSSRANATTSRIDVITSNPPATTVIGHSRNEGSIGSWSAAATISRKYHSKSCSRKDRIHGTTSLVRALGIMNPLCRRISANALPFGTTLARAVSGFPRVCPARLTMSPEVLRRGLGTMSVAKAASYVPPGTPAHMSMPATFSGCSAAISKLTFTPSDQATSRARSTPVCSISASASATWSSTLIRCGSAGLPEPRPPRWFQPTTR